ncbi:deazaflavin-dependent oxidoreductase (nitroreductase family) [Rhodococcus sp. PvR044]|jgi:deazaflavin-dependent oxidoreductase (nitroreductase family)|uniref:nitroreductase/quinone reductase family protein n=1 Tax=unclassified Rhodococcus (in: high G+C Gram-positive bacteria) TaxID=192944 RepID=UPI000BD04252|nr:MULTISPECIES: nitroreductase/quinone reductase family protein [unclassified Rhodococcus (in: high G+C Gram-positive bacteria)]PTR44871.1 deazaflavin-dependent oxidoreductase (nitroreductase family) [Rhodococcus sp. OK611]SNX89206.1 deazaflavin-dependent oxidoreductase, nitroreductase family [Rhodococcus sp. OK270]
MSGSSRYRDVNPLYRAMRDLAGTKPMAWFFARTLHHVDGPVYRLTKGRNTLTTLLTGLPLVMLTTTGAKSGANRTVPLVGMPDGDRIVVIASNYGQHSNPAWYFNLRKHPEATVTVAGGEPRQVVAYEAEGEERERLWRMDLEVYPSRAAYKERATDRRIPVMVLEPGAGG